MQGRTKTHGGAPKRNRRKQTTNDHMSPLFTSIVIVMGLLAVMGIVVGVANDAVNFLNSALGSKAAPRRVILWIAAAGILVGTLTSSGMMEVARSGVFYPGQFSFPEIMMLFLGMMLGNILLLDVAGAFIACTTLLLVRIPNPERSTAQKPSLWREFREGFGAMHAVPGMGWFFTLAVLVWFFIMPVGVMFPLMTLQHFGGGAYEMSLIEIVWGGGALIGGAVMGARTYRVNRIVLINLMYLTIGLLFAASGMLPPTAFALFAALSLIEGVTSSVFNSSFVSVIQSRIDAGVLGRVMSLYYSFGLLPSAIGLLGTGFLAEHVGLTTTFVIAGTVICGIGLVAFCIPSVMRLDRQSS